MHETNRPLPPSAPRNIARVRLELQYLERACKLASRADATEYELSALNDWFGTLNHRHRFASLADARAHFA